MRIQTAVKMMRAVFDDMDKDFTIWEYREVIKELLRCGVFVEHIDNHFSMQHPEWQVKCKVCDKTIDEIEEEVLNGSKRL